MINYINGLAACSEEIPLGDINFYLMKNSYLNLRASYGSV